MPIDRSRLWTLAVLLLVLSPPGDGIAFRDDLSIEEIQTHMRERLSGRHFTATVQLEIERSSRSEQRRLRVWRDDADGGRERFMARFEKPADMRGLAILYLERPEGPNDYFLYQPSIGRVRRVPESTVRQDVYGVDLEYLGFGVAQIEPAEIVALEPDSIGDRRVYRLVEKARRKNIRFDRRTLWLDPESFVPLRAVHERDGRIVLEASTLETREIDGVTTPTSARFARPLDGEVVHMTVEAVDYRSPIPESFFSTLELIRRR